MGHYDPYAPSGAAPTHADRGPADVAHQPLFAGEPPLRFAPAHPPAKPILRALWTLWHRLSWNARTVLVAPFAALALGFVCLFGVMVYFTLARPDPMALRKQERSPTLRILAADGSVLVERGQSYDYVPIDFVPRHVIQAVVATEDRRFFDHWGLDPSGLARAAFANMRARRFAQGGSTLTQQLAKNLFLSSERKLGRKVEELFLALWLELRLSKQDILELYLNRVYFGGGAFGIEAAARRYFDKGARDLTVPEAAVIAGLLKAPSKFSPAANPVLARQRARSVLNKMAAAGYLTPAEEQRVSALPIRFHDPQASREITGLEYAVDYTLERLPQFAGSDNREIVIETTIDGRLQRHAQAELTKLIDAELQDSQAGQASLIVLDLDGGIRALVGGRSYVESQFNRATKAKRQPGSTFKPFVYLAALESGLTPDSTVYDLPVVINGWSPRNESGTYRGAMSLRGGLAQSVNSVAVRLHMDIGPKRTVQTAARLGIRSDLREGPSLALGASEVTLLEMTSAYGAFANGGTLVEPHVIKRIRTSTGRIVYQRPDIGRKPVVALRHVGAMNDMLNASLVSGTGKRAGMLRHPAAGKTGTSQDFRDAWFIGYTGHFVGGVWLGNDNGKAMNKVMGGMLPARLWRDVMALAHEGRATLALPGTSIELPKPKPAAQPVAAVTSPDPIAAALAHDLANPVLPTERIDEAFINRALRDDSFRPAAAPPRVAQPERPNAPPPSRHAAPQQPQAPAHQAGQSSYFREALARLERDREIERRADERTQTRPPEGSMSLGRRPD